MFREQCIFFSNEDIAAIKFLMNAPGSHPYAHQYQDAGATIKFMEMQQKWFAIHNVSNITAALHLRNENLLPFYRADERLTWLENDYISYIDQVRQASVSDAEANFFTNDTYEAIVFTTKSTVQCVRYLLSIGARCVLTIKLNSDGVKSLFGNDRNFRGSNDLIDVRSATFVMETILKLGIVLDAPVDIAAMKESVREEIEQSTATFPDSEKLRALEETLHEELKDMHEESVYATVEIAALANMGGFICRSVDESIECYDCKILLSTSDNNPPALQLVRNLDRGALFYPNRDFLKLLNVLRRYTEGVFKHVDPRTLKLEAFLRSVLVKHLIQVPFLKCCTTVNVDHVEILCKLTAAKFVRAMMKNECYRVNGHIVKRKLDVAQPPRKALRMGL